MFNSLLVYNHLKNFHENFIIRIWSSQYLLKKNSEIKIFMYFYIVYSLIWMTLKISFNLNIY